jgi:predicted nicotinamide N-methyase
MTRTARAGDLSDPTAFIRDNLWLTPVPGLPAISLYTAHPASGLWRLATADAAPYWAYVWSGGAVLARYIAEHPATVRERRVLDLGAGGGIVAIAAAKNGAGSLLASERDAHGRAALALNAEANGVAIEVTGDLTDELAPAVELVLAGDTFYDRKVAARVLPFLDRCLAAGIEVLIGDPIRADLPRERLTQLATYDVPEVGAARDKALTPAFVYRLEPMSH